MRENMIFQSVAKRVFGTRYERMKKILVIWAVVFWGLYTADFRIEIAPRIFYLMVSVLTAGVMWQTLSSEDNTADIMNLFMLPFRKRELVFAYISAIGSYTFCTKTLGLLSVIWAIDGRNGFGVIGSILCAANAIWMSACLYTWRKYPGAGLMWCGSVIAFIFIAGNENIFVPVLLCNGVIAFVLTIRADAYAFYSTSAGSGILKRYTGGGRPPRCSRYRLHGGSGLPGGKRERRQGLVWRYLMRYLTAHKNYLCNTVVMWGAAWVLPTFMGQTTGMLQMTTLSLNTEGAAGGCFIMPLGFAILCMNTPMCILLSCDPALEQSVRFLPGQKKTFCIPYGLFIFLCNMTAQIIYLCSWQMTAGGVTSGKILTAVGFAVFGAVGSLLLEWFCPVRNWKTESDLWHHPRKYVIPGALLLAAAAIL